MATDPNKLGKIIAAIQIAADHHDMATVKKLRAMVPQHTFDHFPKAIAKARQAGDTKLTSKLEHTMALAGVMPPKANYKKVQAASLKRMTDRQSFGQNFAAQFGSLLPELGMGVKEHVIDPVLDKVNPVESGPSRVEQDRSQVAAMRPGQEALSHTGGGMVGSLAKGLAVGIPMAMIPGAQYGALARLGSLAAQGGAMGYLQPSASRGENVSNTLLGAAIAPAADLGLRGLARVPRGISNLANRTVKSRAPQAAARVLAQRATNPARAAEELDSAMSGDTARQATNDVGVTRLENAARKSDEGAPMFNAHDFNVRDRALNRLRSMTYGDVKEPGTRAYKAQKAASKDIEDVLDGKTGGKEIAVNQPQSEEGPVHIATTPADRRVDARPVVDKLIDIAAMAGGNKDPESAGAARAMLRAMGGDTNRKKTLFEKILRAANKGDTRVPGSNAAKNYDSLRNQYLNEFKKPTVREMDAVRRNLSKIALNASDRPMARTRAPSHLIGNVEDKIVHAIDKVAPGYRDAVRSYRAKMAPVNTSQLINDAISSAEESAGGENAGTTASMLGRIMRAARKSKRSISQDEGMLKDIKNMHGSLSRGVKASGIGGRLAAPYNESATGQASLGHRLLYQPLGMLSALGGAIGAEHAGLPWFYGALAGRGAEAFGRRGVQSILDRNAPEITSEVSSLLLSPRNASQAIRGQLATSAKDAARARIATKLAQGSAPLAIGAALRPHPTLKQLQEDAAYKAAHPNEKPLSVDIVNGIAVPASEFKQ